MISIEITEDQRQVLELLQKHGCLKFSTIRGLLQQDRLGLHGMIAEMENLGLIKYAIEDHWKFSGYKITPEGLELIT